MASIRLLRGRIKSIRNISQITKAMEMVAASKMKKAQTQALAGKAYAQKIFEMVMELSSKTDVSNHPLLKRPKQITGKRLSILISTNKGLCGGLNTNLFRFTLASYPTKNAQEFITLGKKGADFVTRVGGVVKADFSDSTNFSMQVAALTQLVTEEYMNGVYDGVDLVFSEFVSALKQTPVKKSILPLTLESVSKEKSESDISEFVIEPSINEVFDALLPHYLENQIRDAVLESEASEHSARMVAMRNATDNALSLISELTLIYNKARQEKITYEISDMVTARLAVE